MGEDYLYSVYLYYLLGLLSILIFYALNLKYYQQLTLIENKNSVKCGSDYQSENITAFRWVFEDSNPKHLDNFLPRALIPHPRQEETKQQCNGWALSLFKKEDKAISTLRDLNNHTPNIYKKLGTHIAVGSIVKSDGINGNHNHSSSHFEHFEYEGSDLGKKFKITTKMYP